MVGRPAFSPSVSSSHGKVLGRGVPRSYRSYIQSNPLPFLHMFFHLSESVMTIGMKTNPEFPERITAVSLYLLPYLLIVLFLSEPRIWRLLLPSQVFLGTTTRLAGQRWAAVGSCLRQSWLVLQRAETVPGRCSNTQATHLERVTGQNTVSPHLSSTSHFGFLFLSLKRNQ